MPGVNWVYLPAGLRLLLVLLLGMCGAVGISLSSAVIAIVVYAPNDPLTGLVAGAISGFAPLTVQFTLQRYAGLNGDLRNLKSNHLLQLTFLYAMVTSFAHQMWFVVRGMTEHFWSSVWPMFVGDLIGTFIVLYAVQAVVRMLRSSAAPA